MLSCRIQVQNLRTTVGLVVFILYTCRAWWKLPAWPKTTVLILSVWFVLWSTQVAQLPFKRKLWCNFLSDGNKTHEGYPWWVSTPPSSQIWLLTFYSWLSFRRLTLSSKVDTFVSWETTFYNLNINLNQIRFGGEIWSSTFLDHVGIKVIAFKHSFMDFHLFVVKFDYKKSE